MMDKKLTPGNWEAACVGMSSAGDDGVEVFEVIADGRVRVAEHLFAADAYACAAAPLMLMALKEAEPMLEAFRAYLAEHLPNGAVMPALDDVRRAIAKATGNAPTEPVQRPSDNLPSGSLTS